MHDWLPSPKSTSLSQDIHESKFDMDILIDDQRRFNYMKTRSWINYTFDYDLSQHIRFSTYRIYSCGGAVGAH